MAEPSYTHDCSQCVYIGSGTYRDALHDWYKCPTTGEGWTLVARYGNEAPQYTSGTFLSCVVVTPLEIRALALGLELSAHDRVKLIRRLLGEKRHRAGMMEHSDYFAEDESNALGKGDWIEDVR